MLLLLFPSAALLLVRLLTLNVRIQIPGKLLGSKVQPMPKPSIIKIITTLQRGVVGPKVACPILYRLAMALS